MFNSILVVCTGNVCRSPIAERLLRKQLVGKKVDSAGVGALVNHSADSSAIAIAEEHGLSLSGHKGQQFSSKMAREYDLILVMDKSHIEQLNRIAPEVRGKTLLLGHWIDQKEIPDPYRQSKEAFEFVYQLIEQSCKLWVQKLNS
ncbi:arsenate reductase/protein-tyrosine-phosphatase family protein [Raoultella terrigena]|jgi:protein-tyrosine phosphatase|uniref:arsenate reductase/protein-tyrosine-phosphatase family protein n=1 Tax=Raoultella terrigena TaxID=577 RepID=UPI000F9E3160|nr:protein tyrosine phosphatase [Raoultella terrigena]QIT27984.1 protein tyrosine phosphatase [Raoultella terrigena]GEC66585.1 phosphatase [Raoultella terrigena]